MDPRGQPSYNSPYQSRVPAFLTPNDPNQPRGPGFIGPRSSAAQQQRQLRPADISSLYIGGSNPYALASCSRAPSPQNLTPLGSWSSRGRDFPSSPSSGQASNSNRKPRVKRTLLCIERMIRTREAEVRNQKTWWGAKKKSENDRVEADGELNILREDWDRVRADLDNIEAEEERDRQEAAASAAAAAVCSVEASGGAGTRGKKAKGKKDKKAK